MFDYGLSFILKVNVLQGLALSHVLGGKKDGSFFLTTTSVVTVIEWVIRYN